MFAAIKKNLLTLLLVLVTTATLAVSTGCIQEMAQLMYVIKGHKIDPPFQGLHEKKVAIVCNSDAQSFGPDALSVTIAKHLGITFVTSEDKITIVAPAKVAEYIDANGWEEDSAGKLGEAVGADFVVVVEVDGYSIHEGPTLYKGRSDWTASAYDVANGGKLAFSNGPNHFAFPETGRPSLQTSERVFESFYLARLTDSISKQFISYDKMETYAQDAMILP